uniref:Ig-like domain-containing protein n=1 Tax=Mola mola TaxID=94237 RepID=A0A3Q3VMA7_MOLML
MLFKITLLSFIYLFLLSYFLMFTQQTVLAAVTEDARLSCQLTQTKDVVLVSWQKHFPVQDKFLASYHKVFGQKVNSDLEGKVEFAEAALQNSSIIIRNVTEQDDGCYLCVFIIFPDGDFTAKTCLQIYELHEPVLHIRDSDSSEETLVSCSATARPAPTVTLRVLQQDLHLSEHSSVSVNNTNGTVTVTATALLSRLHGNSTQVGCALRVLSGRQVEVFMTIPEVKHTSADGEKLGDACFGVFRKCIFCLVCLTILEVLAVQVRIFSSHSNVGPLMLRSVCRL